MHADSRVVGACQSSPRLGRSPRPSSSPTIFVDVPSHLRTPPHTPFLSHFILPLIMGACKEGSSVSADKASEELIGASGRRHFNFGVSRVSTALICYLRCGLLIYISLSATGITSAGRGCKPPSGRRVGRQNAERHSAGEIHAVRRDIASQPPSGVANCG